MSVGVAKYFHGFFSRNESASQYLLGPFLSILIESYFLGGDVNVIGVRGPGYVPKKTSLFIFYYLWNINGSSWLRAPLCSENVRFFGDFHSNAATNNERRKRAADRPPYACVPDLQSPFLSSSHNLLLLTWH